MLLECVDECRVSTRRRYLSGQVPDDLGIGSDLIDFTYCGNCGQIQADFPLDITTLESSGDEIEED